MIKLSLRETELETLIESLKTSIELLETKSFLNESQHDFRMRVGKIVKFELLLEDIEEQRGDKK